MAEVCSVLFAAFMAAVAALPATELKETIGGGPRFSVQLLTGALPPSQQPPHGTKSIVMTKKGGKKYRCHLPDTNRAPANANTLLQQVMPHVTSYLQPLKGTCFYRLEGWWTYEFCFEKGLRQFHQEKVKATANKPESTSITQEYTLGSWWVPPAAAKSTEVADLAKAALGDDGNGAGSTGSSSASAGSSSASARSAASHDDELKEDAKTRKKYWSQQYGNGTMCDMNGKPREAELRLQCSPGEPSFLASVEEMATCRYLVHFSTNLLCKHPGFAADESKEEVHNVQCEPLGPGGLPLPAAKRSATERAALKAETSAADEAGGGTAGTGASVPSRAAQTRPLYDIGECVVHGKYNYRGVIVGSDSSCMQSEAWIRANGVSTLRKGRAQPFYHVLADTRDRPGSSIYYVAHENVLIDTPSEALRHPLLGDFFVGFDAAQGVFVPTTELRERHPDSFPKVASDAAPTGGTPGDASSEGEQRATTVEDGPDATQSSVGNEINTRQRAAHAGVG